MRLSQINWQLTKETGTSWMQTRS